MDRKIIKEAAGVGEVINKLQFMFTNKMRTRSITKLNILKFTK